MPKHLTGEEIRAIVEELNEQHQKTAPEQWAQGMWRIRAIAHLYAMPIEAYEVTYTDWLSTVFVRAAWGSLVQAPPWSYEATDNFEDTHPPESAGAK